MNNQDNNAKQNKNIAKWKTVAQFWDNESGRFWTRNSIFLGVNSALLIAVSSFVKEIIICLFISALGLLFSIFWFKANVRGKYYIDRWRSILAKLEKGDEIDIFGHELSKSKKESKELQKYKPTSTYMQYVVISLSTIWLGFLIYNIYTLINSLIN